MTNLEKYQQIFIDLFSVSAENLEAGFTFRDQSQWDSLAHMQLIGELEDTFDIFFESEDILNYGSYSNGKKILKRYGVEL